MNDYGSDFADVPVEPANFGTDTSSFDAQPVDLGASVDLAQAPAGHAPGSTVDDVPVADDLGGMSADQPAMGAAETEAPIDLAEPMNFMVTNDADSPMEWPEGEAIDLGHNATETETTPVDTTVDRLIEEGDLGAAQAMATPAEEHRAEFDARVDDLISEGTAGQMEIGEAAEGAIEDATEPAISSDQSDLVDLSNAPENEALTAALEERGFELEAVDRFDFSDNPILSYRESAPPEDIASAVNAWNDQIAPGLAAGASREDFEAIDQHRGSEGHQRLAGVYDYFLGSDAIKSGGERDDGSLDVTNGRHRIEQAQRNGVTYLPVKK